MTRRSPVVGTAPARLILLLLALLVACKSEKPLTQIVVAVDSDWDGLSRIDIEIKGFKDTVTTHATLGKGKDALPRRVVLIHDGGPLGPMSVTVRAYTQDRDDPVAIEPRTGIRFVEGKTRLLKIDLLLECIRADKCAVGQACVAGATCVSSAEAAKLVPWDGDVDKLDVDYHVKDGDVLDGDGGIGGNAHPSDLDASADGASEQSGGNGGHGGTGASGHEGSDSSVSSDSGGNIVDSGPPQAIAKFDYTPANVDPTSKAVTDLERADVNLDCAGDTVKFDSSDLSFHGWCGPTPQAIEIPQAGGGDAALVVMSTLSIASGTTLHLVGSRPVILLVFGDAHIAGTIDAGGHGAEPGPGADLDCDTGSGSPGAKTSSGLASIGAGGGGGGGFGSAGGNGGRGGSNSSTASGGAACGEATLEPLRGGCSGAESGAGADGTTFAAAGGGGGALQIAAAGRLQIIGSVLAGGGGGGAASATQAGGGGGGSGGGILLEGVPVEFDNNASLTANGGGGGGGQQVSSNTSEAGTDGAAGVAGAPGGAASGSGGDGGDGASGTASGDDGGDGSISGGVGNSTGGSGGGGGGVGRIRINQATTCLPGGVFSPPPSLGCDDCGSCISASPPESDCTAATRDGELYFLCPSTNDEVSARESCESVDMHLVKIDDQDENDWLASQLSADSWIGATDYATENEWLWEAGGTQFWMGTANGDAVDGSFTNWESGQPDNGPFNADCAVISTDGSWSDHSCLASYAYVCE
jgi:hypothetical protein